MATYTYECKTCNDTFEVKQGMTEERLKCCIKCNNDTLQRVIGGTSFSLKGTGWYVTDFKGDS